MLITEYISSDIVKLFILVLTYLLCPTCNSEMPEEAYLSIQQLIARNQYPVEVFESVTEDGYTVELIRIPYGLKCMNESDRKGPVLLKHGMITSSISFILLGPDLGLGYILADACYDVWMGNARGTTVKKHIHLNTSQPEFWSFSWHEIGFYDLPAMLDQIINVTKKKDVILIGHSEGATDFFVFASTRPEQQHKVKTMISLGPAVFFQHVQGLAAAFKSQLKQLDLAANSLKQLFIPNLDLVRLLAETVCNYNNIAGSRVCKSVLFQIMGPDELQLNETSLALMINQYIVGCSIKQITHYVQHFFKSYFRMFDYGKENNLIKYGTKKPPEYKLERITVPNIIYWGKNDYLASPKDCKKLKSVLPNVIGFHRVPYPNFNHMDFISAKDVKKLLYDDLVKLMNRL